MAIVLFVKSGSLSNARVKAQEASNGLLGKYNRSFLHRLSPNYALFQITRWIATYRLRIAWCDSQSRRVVGSDSLVRCQVDKFKVP